MDQREELDALRRLAELEARKSAIGGEQATADTPAWQVPFVAAGKTLNDLAAGARQATPEPVRGTVDWLNAKLGMGEVPTIDPTQVKREAAMYEPLQKQYPASTFAGEVAPLMARGPAGMAALGALNYGSPQERATNAALGFVGGKAGEAIGAGLSRTFGPRSASELPKLADEFFPSGVNKWNIPLSVGQTTQSKPLQIIESVASNLPGSAGVIAGARDRTMGAFNRALTQTFGEDSSKITPNLLGEAKTKIGGTIGDIASRNSIGVDAPLFRGLKEAEARAAKELTPDEARIVNGKIQELWNSIDPQTGQIPGTLYKSFQSKLGEMAKNRGGTVANIFGDMRTTLREAMTRSVSPEDSAAWLKANQQYFNMRQVADAARSIPDYISPAQLMVQVNKAQKAAKFGGGNDLAELAQWAKQTLPEKIPNSGTVQRGYYQQFMTSPLTTAGSLFGLGYGADKAGVGPTTAAGGLLTPYILARALAGKPTSQATEELLKRLGAGLLGAPALRYSQ